MPNVLFAAIFLGSGVAAAAISPIGPGPWAGLCACCITVGFVLMSPRRYRAGSLNPSARSLVIAGALVAMGAYRASSVSANANRAAEQLTAEAVRRVEGTVGTYATRGSYFSRFGVALDSVCAESCQSFRGIAILAVHDSSLASTVIPGVHVTIEARATTLPRSRNPFTFDYGRYLRRSGFAAEFRTDDAAAVTVVPASSALRRGVTLVREQIRSSVREHIPSLTGRALMTALLLGDRSRIDESVQENFRSTGLTHLLAVSGLHVVVVGYSVYKMLGAILTRLGVGWRPTECVRVCSTILVLLTYYFVAGQSISILRAVIMAVVHLGQHILRRRAILLNSLGVAATIVLLVNPFDLYDIGFQLSFGAVASLALLNPLPENYSLPRSIPRRLRKWVLAAVRSIAASVAATLGTLPILVYHFGFVSFAGIILNLAAIPLTTLALSSGILSVIAAEGPYAVLPGWLGTFAGESAVTLVRLTEWGSRAFGSAALSISGPGTLGAGFMLAALVFYGARRYLSVRWKFSCTVAAITAVVVFIRTISTAPALEVLFLDLGQGDAVMVRTPENRVALVDAGPPPYRAGSTAETIQGLLKHWAAKRIDVAILSHPHTDHVGGLREILENIPVGQIIDNGTSPSIEAFSDYDSVATSLHIARDVAQRGGVYRLSSSTVIEILAPDESMRRSTNLNESSVVVRLTFGTTCALLTGDIEARAEASLVRQYGRGLECSVIKIPHHGSDTSSGPAFVSRASIPDTTLAVASVAKRNRFGLPDEAALTRWTRNGATVLTTQDGAIWLRSDGNTFKQLSWRKPL